MHLPYSSVTVLSWTYNGSNIEVVDNFNYLGVVFKYTGSFVTNRETLAGKGLKAMNVLLNNIKHFNIKPSLALQLFDAFVGATLNYSCEIWNFCNFRDIERVHLKFCKLLLNVKASTSSMGVYGELGRYPLYIVSLSRIVKFWCKIIMSDNIIIKELYQCLINSSNTRNNWAFSVKSLLDNYGFSYVWNNPLSVDLKKFHILFKSTVLDVFKQTWFNCIGNSNPLKNYMYFKLNFGFESYLDFLPGKLRVALTRLRLSSHQLHIETGRYAQNRIERAQRYCILCDGKDIEDEFHFVLICPIFKSLRTKYIKPFYHRRPSVMKFIQLMCLENENIVRNTSKYLHEAFALRQSLS